MAKKTRGKNAVSDDYDSPWKEALVLYSRDFFAFFFPAIESEIDWGRKPVFLDKELHKMEREAKLAKREADVLLKVFRLNGEEAWVLISRKGTIIDRLSGSPYQRLTAG